MGETDVPIENPAEPNEEAYQPELHTMSPPPSSSVEQDTPRRVRLTFKSPQSKEVSSSQNSSKANKEGLSQPPAAFSHRQRLHWLQTRRETGLWVQCDDCCKWRYLPHVLDRHELPKKWSCSLNPDESYANCSIPESPLRVRDEEDLIHSEYSAGSVVWARLPGWPWWPAMVDDCPDTEQFYWIDGFSDIPTHYNVVFFDAFDVTRSWVAPNHLKPYGPYKNSFKHVLKIKQYSKRLQAAVTQANDAEKLPLSNRLAKYSFITRYPGAVNPPKKINKHDLKRYQAQLKRKYNIAFPNESGSDSDEETANEGNQQEVRRVKDNLILVGTPKRAKRARMTKKNKAEVSSSKETAAIDNAKTPNNAVIETDDEPKSSECLSSSEPERNEVDTTDGPKEGDGSEAFKQPSSMLAQAETTMLSESAVARSETPFNVDNDTSKTYVPDTESETEATVRAIQEAIKNIHKRMGSPASDDFDF